jgi:hypothetical protein
MSHSMTHVVRVRAQAVDRLLLGGARSAPGEVFPVAQREAVGSDPVG